MFKSLALACSLAIASIAAPGAAGAETFRVGNLAPSLSGETLDGTRFDLATLRGHIVVVNLLATWCAPCRLEMPELNAFYLRHRQEGLVLVGVSEDRPRDERDVRAAMRGIAYSAIIARRATVNGFGVPGSLPQTIIIDASGIVRAVLSPTPGTLLTRERLESAIAPISAPPS